MTKNDERVNDEGKVWGYKVRKRKEKKSLQSRSLDAVREEHVRHSSELAMRSLTEARSTVLGDLEVLPASF